MEPIVLPRGRMQMLTKKELLGQLTNAKNNYVLGLAAMSLFAEPASIEHLRKSYTSFGGYKIKFDQVAMILAAQSGRQVVLKEFLTMLLRALLKESFELVQNYARDSKQEALFRAQPWYKFARIIRHCVSHDFHFRFDCRVLKQLPVIWNGRTIDASLKDQPLTTSFLGYDGIWELFCELEQFAITALSEDAA